MQEKKDTRARNFATVIYPESVPANWKDILSDAHIPVFVSPLHDKDINPTGEPKKPHYHVIVMYEGKKSREQVLELFSSFGGVGLEVVSSVRGYARYLCHLDNPEKAQYDTSDVLCLGGSDYLDVIGLPVDRYKAIGEMIDFAIENGNSSYSDLLIYSKQYRPDWFRVLCDNGSFVMKEFLKSYEWTETHKQE